MTRRYEVCEKHPEERLLAGGTCARCTVAATFHRAADVYAARVRAARAAALKPEPELLGDDVAPPAMRDGFFTAHDVGWPRGEGEPS